MHKQNIIKASINQRGGSEQTIKSVMFKPTKTIYLLLLLRVTAAAGVDCMCGQVKRREFGLQKELRIVGGAETEVGEYPWQVCDTVFLGLHRLHLLFSSGADKTQRCLLLQCDRISWHLWRFLTQQPLGSHSRTLPFCLWFLSKTTISESCSWWP